MFYWRENFDVPDAISVSLGELAGWDNKPVKIKSGDRGGAIIN